MSMQTILDHRVNSPVGPNFVCENCGADASHLSALVVENETRLHRCRDCGLYQKGTPVESTRYGDDYQDTYASAWRRKLRAARTRLSWIGPLVAAEQTRGLPRLLDIGCSVGATLEAGRELGWQTYGLDISHAAIARCRERGLTAQAYDGFQIPFPSECFHAVTAWHVIEHVPSVRQALAEWHRVLVPDGILAIETPAANCWKARLLGGRYRKFWPAEHTYTFTRESLTSLLLAENFEPLDVGFFQGLGCLPPRWMAYAAARDLLGATSQLTGFAKAFVTICRKPGRATLSFLREPLV